MPKPHATRTYAPLQFDALEPHRFEDLVRNLLYDFRDWQKIEATGRAGSDEGFDVRAFEKRLEEVVGEDEAQDADEARVTEGNLWMIQCKREKQLSASRITAIIDEAVRENDPPYGYVLAAPVNFSKKSYDAFRAALVGKGVSEFHLWGRAELEDMLYQPKNDRILFGFFGISLVSKKRSRVSEIRSLVGNKNRLFRALGPGDHQGALESHVLIRDSNDTHYPYAGKYPDFRNKPRWREYIARRHRADGVRFQARQHFAYIDHEKKEWDSFQNVDLLPRQVPERNRANPADDLRDRVQDFWEHLPLWHQAKELVDGFVRYADIDLVDKEGDAYFRMPHLYVEFGERGPFAGLWQSFELAGTRGLVALQEEYTQVQKFPSELPPKPGFNKVHADKLLDVPAWLVARLNSGQQIYFDGEGKYAYLKQRDVIKLPDSRRQGDDSYYAEVVYRQELTVSRMLELDEHLQWGAKEQLNRDPEHNETLNLLQLKLVYDFQLENLGRGRNGG
jgi:hypothetical protein